MEAEMSEKKLKAPAAEQVKCSICKSVDDADEVDVNTC